MNGPSRAGGRPRRRGRRSAAPMTPIPELVARTRDGQPLASEEIRALIEGFTAGRVPDYQMSAWAMAVLFQGLTPDETTALTLAMRDSGGRARSTKRGRRAVDKHSTGGVGDKVSLCLAPMAAAAGVLVPMVSGRGLGHTGGTLDKLEAIPGFRVDMSLVDFARQVDELGVAMIGQTDDLAPADRRLYALRDVTGTVESVPLITASILSKKLAEDLDGLVLDVKVGRGAFMKSEPAALELAKSLRRVGKLAGVRVSAVLSGMDAPLGYAVGNAVETAEAFEVLAGGGPDDLRELTLVLGAEMLRLAGVESTTARARRALEATVRQGTAADRMEAVVARQGGDPRVVREPDRLPRAAHVRRARAERDGFVRSIDALEVGRAAVALGAGRATVDDPVDPAAGIVLRVRPGDRVRTGDVIAEIHAAARGPLANATARRVREATAIGGRRGPEQALVRKVMRG